MQETFRGLMEECSWLYSIEQMTAIARDDHGGLARRMSPFALCSGCRWCSSPPSSTVLMREPAAACSECQNLARCRLWQRLRPDEADCYDSNLSLQPMASITQHHHLSGLPYVLCKAFPSSDGSGTKASSQCWALRLMSILLGDVCRRTHPAVSAQEQAAAMLFEPGVRTAWCMQFMRMQAGQGQPETAIDSETESAVQSIKSFLKA